MPRIAVIGTTTWGMTLAIMLANKGLDVRLWARTAKEAAKLKDKGPDIHQFPNVAFPPQLSVTSSLSEALAYVNAILLVVPSQSIRQNIISVKYYLNKSTLVISAAKGLEIGSNKRMSEVIAEEINPRFRRNICVLSGPNLYREVLRKLPASAVVKLLTSPNFSVYTNSDIIGVELGGALKNIIALGAGMIDGLGYGDNAKAAFVTRGLTEIAALGVALGANPLTLSGLAGLGDTCASPLSRNHYVGAELTKGRSLEEITTSMTGVAEGISTTLAVWNLARQLGLEMPITEKTYEVLYNGIKPQEAITELLGIGGRHELAGRKWRLFSFLRPRKHS